MWTRVLTGTSYMHTTMYSPQGIGTGEALIVKEWEHHVAHGIAATKLEQYHYHTHQSCLSKNHKYVHSKYC